MKKNVSFKEKDGKIIMINDNSNSNSGFFAGCLILIILVVLGVIVFLSNSYTKENERRMTTQLKQEQSQSAKPANSPTVWADGQLQEMVISFNKVQSNNNSSPLYAGCTVEKLPNGADKLIVYVTDRFLLLTKNEKQLFVEQNFKLWADMAGSRQIKINYDFFEIEISRKGEFKRLATWDSLLGVSIK